MTCSVDFLGTKINVCDKPELMEAIGSASAENPVRVVTPNPEIILAAKSNPELSSALENATHAIIDGFGLLAMLKTWFLKVPCIRRKLSLYHGADCVNDLFAKYSQGEKSFYFIGGKPGSASKAAEAILKIYPQLRVLDAESGGTIKEDGTGSSQLINRINLAKPDILLVGFGAPKQEAWMMRYRKDLKVPVMLGVGGSLDFYNFKPRAPRWVRSIRMEWLYRSFKERGHWRRTYLALVAFPLSSLVWMGANVFKPLQSSDQNR